MVFPLVYFRGHQGIEQKTLKRADDEKLKQEGKLRIEHARKGGAISKDPPGTAPQDKIAVLEKSAIDDCDDHDEKLDDKVEDV